MTEKELKEKIAEVALDASWSDMFGDHYSIGENAANAIADALIANGATIRPKAKWRYDENADEPKCSICGRRALYSPITLGHGAEACVICLSVFCPHCGAEMDGEEDEADILREGEDGEA